MKKEELVFLIIMVAIIICVILFADRFRPKTYYHEKTYSAQQHQSVIEHSKNKTNQVRVIQ